jgi:hypothetical protein
MLVMHSRPIGCHAEPNAGASIVAPRAPWTVPARDQRIRLVDGTWQREVDCHCWTRTESWPCAHRWNARRGGTLCRHGAAYPAATATRTGVSPCDRPIKGLWFDAGSDPEGLAWELGEVPVAVRVWLRRGRGVAAEPTSQPAVGWPRRYGATLACFAREDRPPGPRGRLSTAARTAKRGRCGSTPGPDCTPRARTTPRAAAAALSRSRRAPSSGSRASRCRRSSVRHRRCGSGGTAPARWSPPCGGGCLSAASTWSIPSALANRRRAGRHPVSVTRSQPTAGPGGWLLLPPSCAALAPAPATSGCPGSAHRRRARAPRTASSGPFGRSCSC